LAAWGCGVVKTATVRPVLAPGGPVGGWVNAERRRLSAAIAAHGAGGDGDSLAEQARMQALLATV
jgi:hypothetical protein